ncbi:hypothetical protein CLV30_106151 [Haloactinopolyspora alba]|uniref:Uncharacterized protein n=1 Tax=Haloactinopolyspora alba TaxID=648780 RepID=A0A2P8E3W3_9ACTN|nr:hypothetical protein CLV30_106151 [Haloactinopolyspora alba]
MAYIEVCDRSEDHGRMVREFTISSGGRSARVVLCETCARDMDELMGGGQQASRPRARPARGYEQASKSMEEIEALKLR